MSAETQCMKFRVCMNSEHTVNRVRAFDFARKTFNGGNEIVANKMENLVKHFGLGNACFESNSFVTSNSRRAFIKQNTSNGKVFPD